MLSILLVAVRGCSRAAERAEDKLDAVPIALLRFARILLPRGGVEVWRWVVVVGACSWRLVESGVGWLHRLTAAWVNAPGRVTFTNGRLCDDSR